MKFFTEPMVKNEKNMIIFAVPALKPGLS